MAGIQEIRRLIFRPWPKMIFLWPSTLVSLLMGITMQTMPQYATTWGGVFLTILALNMVVLTFDFPRETSFTLTIVIVLAVVSLLLINQYLEIIQPLVTFFKTRDVTASAQFYYLFFLFQLFLFAGMFFTTRFDYWELEANELIHHTGVMGNIERYPTLGLKLNIEIADVFEYILGGAGRIIVQIPSQNRPIVLDNVLAIKRIARKADTILGAVVVAGGNQELVTRRPEQPLQDEGL